MLNKLLYITWSSSFGLDYTQILYHLWRCQHGFSALGPDIWLRSDISLHISMLPAEVHLKQQCCNMVTVLAKAGKNKFRFFV